MTSQQCDSELSQNQPDSGKKVKCLLLEDKFEVYYQFPAESWHHSQVRLYRFGQEIREHWSWVYFRIFCNLVTWRTWIIKSNRKQLVQFTFIFPILPSIYFILNFWCYFFWFYFRNTVCICLFFCYSWPNDVKWFIWVP